MTKLRDKNAKYRNRAKDAEARADAAEKLADERGRALFHARVSASGKLADAEDLPYSEALLTDDEALTTAIDELITKRPHYASRKPTGDVGQGTTGKEPQPFRLMDRLTQRV